MPSNLYLAKLTVSVAGTFFIFLALGYNHKAHSYFSKRVYLSANRISVAKLYDLSSPRSAASSIGQMFLAKDYASLYGSFDAKLKQMISKEEFISTFDDSYYVSGFDVLSDPKYTSSAQAYLKMRFTYNTGSSKNFDVVFNKSSGKWLLLGTVEY